MGSNIYHILNFIPGLEKEEMLVGQENLAWQLVNSGRFRIDADYSKVNFARFYVPSLGISMMFSVRELYDPKLLPKTKRIISQHLANQYAGESLRRKVTEYITILRSELSKYQKISLEEEMKLARLVVQTAHPVVIMLILQENTEVFVSHSYNIGDMLDITNWRSSGENSGMQSTDGMATAVFISCGGNPLVPNSDKEAIYGDGWPAIARLIVIGGQETGHYSDIMRDKHGRQISRYSADLGATKAKEHVRIGRLKDIEYSKAIYAKLKDFGLTKLVTEETALKFFKKNKSSGVIVLQTKIKIFFYRISFRRKIKQNGMKFLCKFFNDEYPGIMIEAMIQDNLFNLAPQADVYKSENKQIEEAIACVEAVARVPQQVNKWGHDVMSVFMRDLYKVYYQEVIPGCIKAYEAISGKPYSFDKTPMPKNLWYRIKHLFKKRIQPSREVNL
jgi:hypothetical protein